MWWCAASSLLRGGRTAGVAAVRVLLVEDDARFAAVVRSVLDDDGYPVVAVIAAGADVPVAVAVHEPDVVVLDLVLPDSNGLDVADALHAHGRRVPVVLFSSLFDQRIARDTMEAGYGYVEKAAGVEALELAIDAAVQLGGVIDLREAPLANPADS